MSQKFRITGVVRERETGRSMPGLSVRAYDKDLLYSDLLGETVTDASGHFEIRYEGSDFQELFDSRPDIYFKILDAPGGNVLHLTADSVRWNAGADEFFDIAIPGHRLPPSPEKATALIDAHGRPRQDFEAGESLLVYFRDLTPNTRHSVRLLDDAGAEVLNATLLSDRYGVVAPTVLWPDIGIGDVEAGWRYGFETFEQAHAALAGRRFAIEVAHGAKQVRRAEFSLSAEMTQTRLYSASKPGALQRGLLLGRDELRVEGRNLPAGATLDLYLVARQFDWRAGDRIEPVRNTDGSEVFKRVEMARGETSFFTTLWTREQLAPGSYDIIARAVLANEFRADERRVRSSDIISDRLVTSVVIRDDIFRYKPVRLGCVMAMREIACRLLPAPPYVNFTNNFPRGTDVWAALDPAGLMPEAAGRKIRYYVVPHKSAAEWDAGHGFSEVPGTGAEIVVFASCINGNLALVWSNPQLPGKYDLVVDFGNNEPNPADFVADSSFDPPLDMIDGYFNVGFHITDDPSLPGPFAVGRTSYNDPAVTIPATGVWSPIAEDPIFGETPTGTLDLPMRAEVRYPADAAGVDVPFSTSSGSYPLFVIMPGMGLSHTGYVYLLEHLASHGFIAVSIDILPLNEYTGGAMQDARGHAMLAHLSLLQSKNSAPGLLNGKIDLTRVAIAGHSRGGDGVVQAEIYNQSLGLGWNIRAVIAIAPTDFSGTSPTPLVLATSKYLCLFGSNDGDVGTHLGTPYATRYTGTGFRMYDRAIIEKAMVFIRDASHNLFNSEAFSEHPSSFAAVTLSAGQHQNLLRGYVAAFLQWHLLGRNEQKDYFTGELLIPQVSEVEVSTQYRPAPTGARTLDTYESAPAVTQNTLGGAVTSTSLDGTPQENTLTTLDPSSPHQTRGLKLKWNAATARYESTVPLGSLRNVSGYKFFSFRVGQTVGYIFYAPDEYGVTLPTGLTATHSIPGELNGGTISDRLREEFVHGYYDSHPPYPLSAAATVTVVTSGSEWLINDTAQSFRIRRVHIVSPPYDYYILLIYMAGAASNAPSLPQDFFVRLNTAGGGPSRAVRAGYFGPIPYPFRPVTGMGEHYNERRTMAAMKTVRIPLASWKIQCLTAPIVDLSNVESVTFEFDASPSGELLIDDIEFTQ